MCKWDDWDRNVAKLIHIIETDSGEFRVAQTPRIPSPLTLPSI